MGHARWVDWETTWNTWMSDGKEKKIEEFKEKDEKSPVRSCGDVFIISDTCRGL